jgi:AcrR family transcriptional regulator
VLAEEGASALTTRRIASEVGTSTTAVYTYFGSLEGFVQQLVHVGFDHLADRMAAVTPTEDPFTDLVRLSMVYREAALDRPHFYHAMFGASPRRLYRRGADDIRHDLATFETLVRAIERCCAAGIFPLDDTPVRMARKLFAMAHGLVSLELAGFYEDRAVATYTEALKSLYRGLGVPDRTLERTFDSVAGAPKG